MKNAKLIRILKTLEEEEFKKLHKFLRSPYFNYNQQVVELYRYLRKYYPDFNSANLDREKVFNKLFPDQEFDLNKLRKLMSALTQLVEEYLLHVELEKNVYKKKKWLTNVYKRRNLPGLFRKSIRELIEEQHASNIRNGTYYFELMELNRELFFHPETDKQEPGKELLIDSMEYLDAYYALTKLQLSAEMRTRENILAESYTIKLLPEVMQEARRSLASHNLLYLLYLNIIDLHQREKPFNAFSQAVALLRKVMPQIDREEKQNLLLHLINHCIRLINRGDSQYKIELFELYKLGIEHQLLLENNQITEITFSNIVATGASMKAFDWTRGFIDNFAGFLKKDIRGDIKALSLALLHFNKKDYEQTERALLGHNFSDLFNLLKSRCLLIRTYYEHFLLDDSYYIFLLDQCDAFEKSIRRNNRIAKSKKLAYLNFIKFIKKLAQQIMVQEDNNDLAQELNDQKVILYKDWLLQKIQAI